MESPARPKNFEQLIKRQIDFVVSAGALVALSPLLLATAGLILCVEGRPILYVSRRQVSPTRTIRVWKFRSMVRDARSPRYALADRFMKDGFLDIPLTCEAYTPIGRILERFQIVEMPQLLNVLTDGMSLVGNRPLPPGQVELLMSHHADALARFEAPTGITGIAQVVGKMNLTPIQRLDLERRYADVFRDGHVLLCDGIIAFYTLRVILGGEGLSLEEAHRVLDACAAHPRSVRV